MDASTPPSIATTNNRNSLLAVSTIHEHEDAHTQQQFSTSPASTTTLSTVTTASTNTSTNNHAADSTPMVPLATPNQQIKQTIMKKKRKGFFRSLGYETLNTPITILSSIVAVALALAIAIRQGAQPTLQYCTSMKQCPMVQELLITDIIVLAVCAALAIICILAALTIIMAPGMSIHIFNFSKAP